MGDVAVQKVHGEARVVATYAGDELFLEGANGFFGMVGVVTMRRDQLNFLSALAMNLLSLEGHSLLRSWRVGLRPHKQRYL